MKAAPAERILSSTRPRCHKKDAEAQSLVNLTFEFEIKLPVGEDDFK